MKEKIMIFIIGLLVGAVIATGSFFVYSKVTTCNTTNNSQIGMPGGNPPSMSNGQNNNGEPPEKPDGENGEPPEKPSDSTNQDSNQKSN